MRTHKRPVRSAVRSGRTRRPSTRCGGVGSWLRHLPTAPTARRRPDCVTYVPGTNLHPSLRPDQSFQPARPPLRPFPQTRGSRQAPSRGPRRVVSRPERLARIAAADRAAQASAGFPARRRPRRSSATPAGVDTPRKPTSANAPRPSHRNLTRSADQRDETVPRTGGGAAPLLGRARGHRTAASRGTRCGSCRGDEVVPRAAGVAQLR